MRNTPLIVTLFLVSAVLTVQGCVKKMYAGPELPRNQVAIIQTSVPFFGPRAVIWVLDEKQGGWKIAVHPGKHTLKVYLAHCNNFFGVPRLPRCYDGPIDYLTFTAEADHTYFVYGSGGFFSRKEWIWLEDVNTQQVVAGEKPE